MTLVTVAVIGAVPPLRRTAALVSSRVVLFVLSPLAPDISGFDDLAQGSRVVAADGTVLAELDGAQRRDPVRLATLPEHVRRAVLAAEDANFYSHGGIDPSAVFRAFLRNAQGGRQGGSTITQQLAKLNFTNSERTYLRKLREVQYAVRLEDEYTKDQLLERYLNQVYFGDGAYGLAAAAQSYFAVAPEQLSPAQAATLAGMIKAPEALDPRKVPARVTARRDQVLRNMRRRGWLQEDQLQQALAAPLEVAPPAETTGQAAPHFVEYVKREAAGLDELGGSPESRRKRLFTGGYTIKTTLDPKVLQAAAKAVQDALPEPGDPNAAVVGIVPGDGAIKVLFGGRDFATNKFDLASQGRRQPGSSFKPFVYLAAVAKGIDPRSTFDASSPRTLEYRGERYTVANYEDEGGGRSDLDRAMAHSFNTVFAQLILEVGPAEVTRTAEELGVADVDENVGARPAIALGGLHKGVTPLEQAAAFATFAAKGVYAEPYAITEILDREGHQVFKREPKTEQVFEPREVGVLNAALERVVREGTGRGADIGRSQAGKTGTTQEYGDAWFVGFVPQLATAVWVGHPEGSVPMTNVHGRKVTGGSFPALIWASTMRQAVDGLPQQKVFTATPDSLGLKRLDAGAPAAVPPGNSTTSSSTSSSTTMVLTDTSLPATSTTTTAVTLPQPIATTTTTTPKARQTTTTLAPSTTSSTTSSSSTTTTTAAATTTTTTP
ncbi:MAG TPA: transglycosylase domain-containing protein [Acidimicrobiales bacterium]|nr:transglycosylase domain-containing protein [Acidimicrobiales bacterium]